jgi:mRNA interferase HigB
MNIISFKRLKDFFTKDPNARVALQDWYRIAKKAAWENFYDVRNTFNSVDNVGNNRYVFNVKGNHYRIVAIIRFSFNRIFIRWVGSHKDYDKLKNIDKL